MATFEVLTQISFHIFLSMANAFWFIDLMAKGCSCLLIHLMSLDSVRQVWTPCL